MVNLILKYFWMYMLIGFVINFITAFGTVLYIGYGVQWNIDSFKEAYNIIGGDGYYDLILNLFDSKEGRTMLFKSYIITQLVWPVNVITILSKMPEVNVIIKQYRQNLNRQA